MNPWVAFFLGAFVWGPLGALAVGILRGNKCECHQPRFWFACGKRNTMAEMKSPPVAFLRGLSAGSLMKPCRNPYRPEDASGRERENHNLFDLGFLTGMEQELHRRNTVLHNETAMADFQEE